MGRSILQIPLKIELRKKAEKIAENMGFSSIQEMIRVMLTQVTNDNKKGGVDDICIKYGIKYLGLFGSVARGEENIGSDVDLLVNFKNGNTPGIFGLAKVQKDFEKRLGRKVDLVTKINRHVKPYIMKDLKTIYEEK